MTSTPRAVQSVDNTELYNRWAKVYDTDGNILQAIDDLQVPSLLNTAFSLLSPSSSSQSQVAITITELGCGTGRNTLKLLSSDNPITISTIHALDLSPGMLDVARQRCAQLSTSSSTPTNISFHEFDALNPQNYPSVNLISNKANLVLSTLVLEHIPIAPFFAAVKSLLVSDGTGGVLVLTNMHSEMGNISQAGFVDEESGEKVRGLSFAHTVEEVVEGARKEGFELVGEMEERGINEEDVEAGRVSARGKKWIGVKVWYGGVFRLKG